MTRSTGRRGLIRRGSPPRRARAARIAARSTTAGTPVKSCIRTRAGRKGISGRSIRPGAQAATARTSWLRMRCSSTWRRTDSSSRRIEKGSGSSCAGPACSSAVRPKMVISPACVARRRRARKASFGISLSGVVVGQRRGRRGPPGKAKVEPRREYNPSDWRAVASGAETCPRSGRPPGGSFVICARQRSAAWLIHAWDVRRMAKVSTRGRKNGGPRPPTPEPAESAPTADPGPVQAGPEGPLEDALHSLVTQAVALLKGDGGGYSVADPVRRTLRCVVATGTPATVLGTVLQYGEGASGNVAETGTAVRVDDYRIWPGRSLRFEKSAPFRAVVSVPTLLHGQVTGVLHVLRTTQGQPFSQNDVDLLNTFANQAGAALENARLFAAVDTERQRVRLLYEVGRETSASLDAVEILRRAIGLATGPLGGSRGAAYLLEPEGGRLRLVAVSPQPKMPVEDHDRLLELRLGKGLGGWVAERGEAGP